jgi:hypothetical protein
MAETSNSAPWHAAYPAPRNKDPDSISRAVLLQRLEAGEKPGVDFLLIDLRRTDHEVQLKLTTTGSRMASKVILLRRDTDSNRVAPSAAR